MAMPAEQHRIPTAKSQWDNATLQDLRSQKHMASILSFCILCTTARAGELYDKTCVWLVSLYDKDDRAQAEVTRRYFLVRPIAGRKVLTSTW